MSTSTFRQTVALVAARAKAILPAAVNGRVESAVALVLAHDVLFLDNGTVEVGSASDPLKVHVLSGSTCDCADFPRAPESWCKHRLAAGIAKRVHQEMSARSTDVESETEVILPEEMEVWGDNDHEGEEAAPPSQPPAPTAPLPEAPASVNCHLTIAGRQVQLTLRDLDEARLLVRLQAVLAQYPVSDAPAPPLSPQQHHAAAINRPTVGFCQVHSVQMIENEKNGQRWYSHRLPEGGFCKGR
jgi:hypothetical protein